MSQPLCLTCSKPFEIIKVRTGPNQKRFCSDHCNDTWWNEQPLHPVIPRVDAHHPRALELKQKRTQLVLLEKADPYTYGFIPDHWEIANTEFQRINTDRLGRQSQTWVRFPEGWRIVAAHVSLQGDAS